VRHAWFALAALLAALPGAARGQDERTLEREAAAEAPLDDDLRLRVEDRLRVLDVAAHPDDEDSGLLCTFALQGAQPFVLYSTRGEGGQNAAGDELSTALGEKREDEVLAANRVVGAHAWFLGFDDFGFCKRPEEAFERWGGREEVVRRMTKVLRTVRPHRVYTNHTQTGGHGHHQATALALFEAVVASADPARFPEQLAQGLAPWRVDALFVRVTKEERDVAEKDAVPIVDATRFDYDLPTPDGKTIVARAHDALLRHASQGPWPDVDPTKKHDALYHLSWTSLEAKSAAELPDHRVPLALGRDAPFTLIELLKALAQGEPADAERTSELLQAALGLDFVWPKEELTEPRKAFAPGEESEVWILAHGRDDLYRGAACAEAVRALALQPRIEGAVANVSLHPLDELVPVEADRAVWRGVFVAALRFTVPGDAPLDRPERAGSLVTKEPFVGSHRWPIRFALALEAGGTRVGALAIPLPRAIAPPLVVEAADAPLVFLRPRPSRPALLRLEVRFPTGRVPPAPLTVELRGDGAAGAPRDYGLVESTPTGEHALARVAIVCDAAHNRGTRGEPRFEQELALQRLAHPSPPPASAPAPDGSDRLPDLTLELYEGDRAPGARPLASLTVPVKEIGVLAPRRAKVAFVAGSDGTAGRALRMLGIETRGVTPEELGALDLATVTTVLLDLRTLGGSETLRAQSPRLKEFVAGGGHVVVLYQKSGEWNPFEEKGQTPAPLPLKLTDERVVDETAPVRILKPGHPLLMNPNVVSGRDFDGWVQERGLYFPKESYDAGYDELLAMADPGAEAPLKGGLLAYKNAAGGTFVYCALSLHRQLRAGVGGAWRLFSNLVGYGLRD
jgi:LmbE family N-acetylglucosaminyl deacetylase